MTSGEVPATVGPDSTAGNDRRRWITLAIACTTAVITALDTTILTVAIPTILRDFGTTLPSLQWVITGYALTFASLLIIGGRLGDIFGQRRVFVVGTLLFGVGSLMAALSNSVPQLVIGEAVIEGVGAALMLPAGLAIVSRSFVGHERAVAFGVWGAAGGAGAVLGPAVGGILASDYSWRWCFGLNVFVVPIAVGASLVFMPKLRPDRERERLDITGAFLVAFGMALLLFGLSEGGRYGWLTPSHGFVIGGTDVWPTSRPVSVVVVAFLIAFVVLTTFYRVSRRKERDDAAPLFQFGQFRNRAFRFGLITLAVLALGQMCLAFVLPVFLQEGRGLSARTNGLWQLPIGVAYLTGAQVASRLARRMSQAALVRVGLLLMVSGSLYLTISISPDLTFVQLLPAVVGHGVGAGFAIPSITNIVMTDVESTKSGAASGALNTARQMCFSLGVAVIGALLSAKTIAAAVVKVEAADGLSASIKARAVASVRANGVVFAPPLDASAADIATLRRVFAEALASGARWPFVFATITGTASLALSAFIPTRRVQRDRVFPTDEPHALAAH